MSNLKTHIINEIIKVEGGGSLGGATPVGQTLIGKKAGAV